MTTTDTYTSISMTVSAQTQVNLTDAETREYLMWLEDPTAGRGYTDEHVHDLREQIARFPGGREWVAGWDRELAEWSASIDADLDESEDGDAIKAAVAEMKAETAAELREWATRDGRR
jgi:hypothetical protein